jgi:hypothetical protein
MLTLGLTIFVAVIAANVVEQEGRKQYGSLRSKLQTRRLTRQLGCKSDQILERLLQDTTNPAMSPHLSFVDMGGHGYSVVHITNKQIETEFVCIPRPIDRHHQPDGGPLLYRVRFRAELWEKGKSPKLETRVLEGDPRFSL